MQKKVESEKSNGDKTLPKKIYYDLYEENFFLVYGSWTLTMNGSGFFC